MTKLVIVESPTKARTIAKFLPDDYRVEACMGHVRDLPSSAAEIPSKYKANSWAKDHGIDIEQDFSPLYVVPATKRKIVSQLREALQDADSLVIATDEDREGEAIGWHLTQVLAPDVPVRRMVFHEITRTAIQNALDHERDIDENLVRAQEVRRILDRLVGYTVSPVLWKKIAPGLSAGRVQSVAVRLLVDREKKRRAFRSAAFWEIKAQLSANDFEFTGMLSRVGDRRIATARDFDESSGELKNPGSTDTLTEESAKTLIDRLSTCNWVVSEVERKKKSSQPAPPFATSTLQQEANRKLSLSAAETMRIAQRLYERGLITYMRTDSVHLSTEAIDAARQCVESRYGSEYLYKTVRQYTTQSKGAQEAHEAIRPAGNQMLTGEDLHLAGREKSLYDMIWKRTVATQMADSQQELINARILADDALFRANGKRILFPGFMRAYVEGKDDPSAALENREIPIPDLQENQSLSLVELTKSPHETRPPSRYTEAALVQTLEKEGIGRPSTYANIIQTILNRDYARKTGNTLIPTFTAFGVTQLMLGHFENLVNTKFTATMEEQLDGVANGSIQWLPYLKSFWTGEGGLLEMVTRGKDTIDPRAACTLNEFDDLACQVRIGRYGPYLEVEKDGDITRIAIPDALPPGDLSSEQFQTMLREKSEGREPIAVDPNSSQPIFLLTGRYGPFLQLGEVTPTKDKDAKKPKRVSLPKGLEPENVSAELAISLIQLPRALGTHPEQDKPILAGIGRYGPYVSMEKDFRSLTKTDDVLTVTLERALELLNQEKPGRTTRRSEPLRTLGNHPDDGDPVNVMDGRYGPYVKHGRTNATLPKQYTTESITLEEALILIQEKIDKGPTKKRSRNKSSRK
jgi:DNA topoisomerase-1